MVIGEVFISKRRHKHRHPPVQYEITGEGEWMHALDPTPYWEFTQITGGAAGATRRLAKDVVDHFMEPYEPEHHL